MHQVLGRASLANGDRVEIVRVEAPSAEFREAILNILAHKGADWQVHLREALDGRTDALETRWYLAVTGGHAVANAMTVERHGVGILGHVYTKPDYRQQGLCKAVLTCLMDDFRSRGGRALLLGTGYESVAYRIYESIGFQSLRGGFMQYLSTDQQSFDAGWFGPGDAVVSPARWEHWPLVSMLAARTGIAAPRSVEWGLEDIGNLEHSYCRFMGQVLDGEASGTVAVTHAGAVVACATRTPLCIGSSCHAWPGAWLVDAFAHPLHGYKMELTLGALEPRPGKHLALVPVADSAKMTAFLNNGFSLEGTSRGLALQGAIRADVAVLGRLCE